jgi:uncharacterized protein (TIGR02996 family)
MPYPENPALLAAVIADAEDDAPRLVYADWLDEHGDPDRAAFIRNQCALFDTSPADPDYVNLTERRLEIRAAMLWRRLGPKLPRGVGFRDNIREERDDSEASYQRGFPYYASEPVAAGGADEWAARKFREVLPTVIATTTLRGLWCWGGFSRHLGEILSSPAAAHLTALSATNDPVQDGQPASAVQALLSSCSAPGLKWLNLMHLHSTADTNRLARAALGRVRRLELPWVTCEPASLHRLCAADWFGRLRRVWVRLAPENAAVGVAGLSRLPELHTLALSELAPAGVAPFAGRGRFPALGGLFLCGTALQGEGAVTLGRAELPKLAVLKLDGCGLRNAEVAALAASGLLDRLRVLSLANNDVGDRGVAALAAGPWAAALRVLHLGGNAFGRQGLGALARPGALPELTTLDLHSLLKPRASAADLARFLTALEAPRLLHLDLTGWAVDDAGLKALAGNPAFANLTCLHVGDCGAGPDGAKSLFTSPNLRRLVTLKVWSDRMGEAFGMLKDPALLPNLLECWLPEGVAGRLRKRLEAARGPIFN